MPRSQTVDQPLTGAVVYPAVIRPGVPTVRTTFQCVADIAAQRGRSITNTWAEAVTVILRWLQKKFPKRFPAAAWRGHGFESEVPGQSVECIEIDSLGAWAIRLVQPDAPFRDRAAVPGRTWTTEIALRCREDLVQLGVRVLCASLPYSEEEIALTRPRAVIDLANKVGLHEIRPLDGRPWALRTQADLTALRDLLASPQRTLPVYLLTRPDRRRLPGKVSEYLLDAEFLARQTQALAHVVTMPTALGFQWTGLVGKQWSAYLGAARTYRPGLDFEHGSPVDHPLAVAERILFWRHNSLQAERAFEAYLVEQAYVHASRQRVAWGDRLFLTDAKTKQTEIARQQVQESQDWQALCDAEVGALKAKAEELEGQCQDFSDITAEAERERDLCKDENARLRAVNDALRAALQAKTGATADVALQTPIPSSYEDLPAWVDKYLVGRLELHPRAHRGLGKARYKDVRVVYQALLLLANEYRDMRLGVEGAKQAYERRLGTLGLQFSGSISRERAGEKRDTYFVKYPIGTQRNEFLEWHLTKGTSRDPRHSLRIYFFWHDETQQVVVGWLPSHLTTRIS